MGNEIKILCSIRDKLCCGFLSAVLEKNSEVVILVIGKPVISLGLQKSKGAYVSFRINRKCSFWMSYLPCVLAWTEHAI